MIDDILYRVTLLGILKKKPEESLEDVMEILIDTGMYEKPEATKVFDALRASGHIVGEGLSFIGVDAAQKAEREFKQ
jgi:tRNA splicing endonuclease